MNSATPHSQNARYSGCFQEETLAERPSTSLLEEWEEAASVLNRSILSVTPREERSERNTLFFVLDLLCDPAYYERTTRLLGNGTHCDGSIANTTKQTAQFDGTHILLSVAHIVERVVYSRRNEFLLWMVF